MMEIKIHCGCGSKYKFDVEPVEGRMPFTVRCPTCNLDGTKAADDIILQKLLEAAQLMTIPAAAAKPVIASAPVAVAAAAPIAAAPPVSAAPPAGLRVAGIAPVAAAAPESYVQAATGGSLLECTTFFIKERAGILALSDTYDILDPASGRQIGIAKEELPIWFTLLRFVQIVDKSRLPTTINIYEQEGQPPVLSIRRGFTFLRQKIRVVAGKQSLGYFKSKLISIGGGFYVYDNQDQEIAEVKGNWKGWDFRFINKNGREIGTVTKKWAGLGKELFTSADNYVISLTDLNGASPAASALLLAAGLAIDIVYNESE